MENREKQAFKEKQAQGYILTIHKGWIKPEEKAEAAAEWDAFWEAFDKQTGRA